MATHALRQRSVQIFVACLLALSLIVGLTWALTRGAAAQPASARPSPAPQALRSSNATTQEIPLGEPGLSFRYVDTFGEAEVPYFDDPNYLHYPYGISTDGNNLWISESWGRRALKFANDGSFLMQIGKAGFRYAVSETDIEWVFDVGVDPDGNVWLVDADAAHVIKFDADGNYVSELGQRYNGGQSNDHFYEPIGIAFDSAGNIYVSDSVKWGDYGNQRIQVFDSEGNYLNTIGETGVSGSDNAHFNRPWHIAIFDDSLYVADTDNQRVQIFDVSDPISPTYTTTLGVTGEAGSDNSHFNEPQGVAVDANYVYVVENGNQRVQVFDRATHAYVATIGTGWGTGDNEFIAPRDVAVDSAGNVYVADSSNIRVQQFDSDWNYVRTYGTTGVPYLTDGRHYNQPRDVAVAPDGSIYIAERLGQRLVKLNAEGTPQWIVGEAGVCDTMCGPNGVTLDSAGRVYVTEGWANDVEIYHSDGSYVDTLGTGQGSGDYEFNNLYDTAVDVNGTIYVTDSDNNRIQVYDSSLTYVATLGETGVTGADNAHFNDPRDVAVDAGGNIYVADRGNHRVQVFDSNRNHVRTLGVTGECGDDFGHLCDPTNVTVDQDGRVYVSDDWGGRIQVFDNLFDNNGAYLTTIGGSEGSLSGQLRGAAGLTVDGDGNLYVADSGNHRIQKFARGVPDWQQSNLNGFGQPRNQITTLAPFEGTLYAGTFNSSGGAQLWRKDNDGEWGSVMTGGFGDGNNVGVDHLIEFNGYLYAGTWNYDYGEDRTDGGEVWRSEDGEDWSLVMDQGFGVPSNAEIFRFAVFSDTLYAGTYSYADDHGGEIWRSTTGITGDWNRVVENGFGDVANQAVLVFQEFNGYLYAGTYNLDPTESTSTGGEVWRSSTGDPGTWSQVNIGGFGDAENRHVRAFATLGGYLYAGTSNPTNGGEVWRCAAASGCDENSDWSQVVSEGFGDANNTSIVALIASTHTLYAVTYNGATGMEVWQSQDGTAWRQVGFAGFGDSNNFWTYWDNAVTMFDRSLHIGTWNYANGGEVWRQKLQELFLPLVLRSE